MSDSGVDYASLAQQAGAISSVPAPSDRTASPSFLQNFMHPANAPGGDENSSDLPLTSYGAATRSGFNSVANDTISAIKGALSFANPNPASESEKVAFELGGPGAMFVHRLIAGGLGSLKSVGHVAAVIEDINRSPDPLGTYLKIAQRTSSQGAAAALTALGTEGAIKGTGAIAGKVRSAGSAVGGIVREASQGADIAQPGAQSAIREGVQASTESAGTADETLAENIANQPLVEGHTTVLDEHLNALKENEASAYQEMDNVAGFDVKAEKLQLSNDKYKLTQLGNTDADITQRGNLIESINDSEQRIADAEAKLKEADIDPKAADAIHQQRMAGEDFKKSLVSNTNPADQSVKIRGLLRDAKKLQFSDYGDRLEQFFGSKEAAESYVEKLQKMDELGAHAIKTQAVADLIKKYIIAGAATAAGTAATGGAIYGGYKAITGK